MVKIVLSFLLLFSFTFADETLEGDDNNLTSKIKSFLDVSVYETNRDFINIIFDPESDFYKMRELMLLRC